MFRVITDGSRFREHVLLKDGGGVLLRMATPDDIPALEALFSRVSQESLQMRFMGTIALVSRKFIDALCAGDAHDSACLLAITGEAPDLKIVGFGNYVALGVRHVADVAFLVDDAWQGRGISTLLLERLAGIAAGAGFVGFEADVLFENQAMINVFRGAGFELKQVLDGGSYHLEFPLAGAVAGRERAELRERIAVTNSVSRLLRPRVVAVAGASRERTSVGGLIFEHILKNDFTGTVYPVNNRATSVHGVRAYASVSALPEPADLVVVAVPAENVLEVAEDAMRAGAKGLIVVTSGFAEAGTDGAERQKRLVEIVRAQGARLVGPNCLGLLNTDPDVRLDASLAPTLPPVGRVGFYSHSAALGLVILQYAAERGLGFSTFVSAGNRADLSGNDLLQYWEEDPATDIAMLYLEMFGNPRRFARVARRISRRKPVLCVKSARSRAGSRAARAHIGARPVSDVEVDALFQQAGVIRVDTLEELFDVALLLAHQPLPPGNRTAIVGNSGGVVTITADACEAHGLVVSRPGLVDLGPLAQPEDYRHAVQQALEDPQVDAVIAIFLCVSDCNPRLVERGIRRGVLSAEIKTGVAKPVLLSMMGDTGLIEFSNEPANHTVAKRVAFPSYRFPEAAARALAHAAEYGAYRREPAGQLVWYEDTDAAAARSGLEEALGDRAEGLGPHWLEGEHVRAVLAGFGVKIAPAGKGPRADESIVDVTVRSHPDFGPLMLLQRAGVPSVVRITPLTDRDVRMMLDLVGVAPEGGEAELLGRISQLVEEMPWLVELQGEIVPARVAGHAAMLGHGVRAAFTPPSRVAAAAELQGR